MSNPFDGLSKSTLRDTLLSHLAEMSNLKKESRQLRQGLSNVRSELQRVQFELEQIQCALSLENVLGFTKLPENQVPEPKRKIGRWGTVTYELDQPAQTKLLDTQKRQA